MTESAAVRGSRGPAGDSDPRLPLRRGRGRGISPGDAEESRDRFFGRTLRRVRRDLERRASGTGLEGEIGLVVLGDVLYPAGLHAADHPRRELDSIRPSGPHEPLVSLVSGSASRLTPVRQTPESLFVRSAPGYARVLVLRDGTLRLEVVAAPPRFRRCPDQETGAGRSGSEEHPTVDTTPPPAEVAGCLRRGARAYRTVWVSEITPARRGDR